SITDMTPTLGGGSVATWQISPVLPAGLSFSNGIISGTPAVNMTQTTYTIYANNSGGNTSLMLQLKILEVTPEIILSTTEYSLVNEVLITRIVPVSVGGPVEYYTISPSLPLGLLFDSVTGSIYGVPEGLVSGGNYTITAYNSGGNNSLSIYLQIVSKPPKFSLPSAFLRETEFVEMTPFTPFSTGGNIELWSIDSVLETLPEGLIFDNLTGTISGTPVNPLDETTFSITATNSGGSLTQIFLIKIQADFDRDGIPDVEDQDDDNDGVSDAEEIKEGSDPFANESIPVEGFEVFIPGTRISLGAWDLIAMSGGIPLFIWISFGFVTRNSRSLKFENLMRETKNKKELEKVSGKVELCLTVRLLGVNQGIRLDKLRTELEGKFASNEMELELENDKTIPVISDVSSQPSPSTPAEQIDGNGYEWVTHNDGNKWYRVAKSESEWFKFE
ncbi:putative Ig domain-containing protein, partial [Euryarchaeota archaeon]|nr:putative Ig domain-containing protein [Euryarchaeota archaeon]MDA9156353.1 putative Ig domain-containing protein [Candidatus Poseidoniaceae archaeon]